MGCAYSFDELPVVQKLGLVLDVIARNPRLDLVPQSLEFLDLSLQICLQLLLLGLICRSLHLVVYALEELDTLRDLRACCLEEALVLREEVATAGVRVVRARARRVLERGELLVTRNLEDGEALREREHVEDEHLELHAVRLRGLDGLARCDVDVRDLLARDVERELALERLDRVQDLKPSDSYRR